MACLRPAWSASLFALVAACFVAACSPREAAVPTPREDRSGAGPAASAATPATASAGAEAGVGVDAGAGASTGASADSNGAADVGAAAPGSSASTAGAATPPLKGPITAAEAAELNLAASTSRKLGAPAAGAQDGGASEDAPCAKDADCAFTRFEAGNCCPILCTPRVVTKRRAAELEATFANCNGGRQCPHPLCQPPRAALTPVCEARRCAARLSGPANSPRD
jgi:hypothetical protein